MNQNENLKNLMEKYPRLFKGDGPRCGFYIGEGWMPLVTSLCSVLHNHLEYSVPEEIRHEMYVDQIKEKFGFLRYYMNQETSFMSGAIALAESMSGNICEECSAVGKRRNGGWIKTLCDSCVKE